MPPAHRLPTEAYDYDSYDISQLDDMIYESQIITRDLIAKRKAVEALYSLVTGVTTGKVPSSTPESIESASSYRYSPSAKGPDLSKVPIEVYSHQICYLTPEPLGNLAKVENVLYRSIAWLRGQPIPAGL
jgi:hypothetical protein